MCNESRIIPYIKLNRHCVVFPKNNPTGDHNLFTTVGWRTDEQLPNNDVNDIGVCREGHGMLVKQMKAHQHIDLEARTRIRCHDRTAPSCKCRVSFKGIIVTYGELLLAAAKYNQRQTELIDWLRQYPEMFIDLHDYQSQTVPQSRLLELTVS